LRVEKPFIARRTFVRRVRVLGPEIALATSSAPELLFLKDFAGIGNILAILARWPAATAIT
jgi:hypothetical protein